ncbi:hypothetical protein ACL02U_10020 [Streptomyces sp. MS06]|uniref:hypothetical protein n=1 Tax=Streptomyces sp. MS06 TaxID=3385974 RepID=UPI0039A0E394
MPPDHAGHEDHSDRTPGAGRDGLPGRDARAGRDAGLPGGDERPGRDGLPGRADHPGPGAATPHPRRGDPLPPDPLPPDPLPPDPLPPDPLPPDPLMAAITGEPLPEEAREDAALLAEHRAAIADVALLREGLTALGDALAAPPRPEPPRARAVARRPRRRLLPAALGTAAAAALVGLVGWLVVQAGSGAHDDAAASAAARSAAQEAAPDTGRLGDPRYLACLRLLAEGDVTGVRPVPGTGRQRVTLRVTRSYLPGPGGAPAVTVLVGPDAVPAPREGGHVLVGVERGAATAGVWVAEPGALAAARAELAGALPAARGLGCG